MMVPGVLQTGEDTEGLEEEASSASLRLGAQGWASLFC